MHEHHTMGVHRAEVFFIDGVLLCVMLVSA
jgi:hypothetical protein